jgi:hypothetical protein
VLISLSSISEKRGAAAAVTGSLSDEWGIIEILSRSDTVAVWILDFRLIHKYYPGNG